MAAFSCQNFIADLPSSSQPYRFGYWGFLNGGACSSFDQDGSYRFPKTVAVLGSMVAWIVTGTVCGVMQMWWLPPKIVRGVALSMLCLALCSLLLLLVGLRSTLSLRLGPGGVAAIVAFVAWLVAAVTLVCCVVPRELKHGEISTKEDTRDSLDVLEEGDQARALSEANFLAEPESLSESSSSSSTANPNERKTKRGILAAIGLGGVGFGLLRRRNMRSRESSVSEDSSSSDEDSSESDDNSDDEIVLEVNNEVESVSSIGEDRESAAKTNDNGARALQADPSESSDETSGDESKSVTSSGEESSGEDSSSASDDSDDESDSDEGSIEDYSEIPRPKTRFFGRRVLPFIGPRANKTRRRRRVVLDSSGGDESDDDSDSSDQDSSSESSQSSSGSEVSSSSSDNESPIAIQRNLVPAAKDTSVQDSSGPTCTPKARSTGSTMARQSSAANKLAGLDSKESTSLVQQFQKLGVEPTDAENRLLLQNSSFRQKKRLASRKHSSDCSLQSPDDLVSTNVGLSRCSTSQSVLTTPTSNVHAKVSPLSTRGGGSAIGVAPLSSKETSENANTITQHGADVSRARSLPLHHTAKVALLRSPRENNGHTSACLKVKEEGTQFNSLPGDDGGTVFCREPANSLLPKQNAQVARPQIAKPSKDGDVVISPPVSGAEDEPFQPAESAVVSTDGCIEKVANEECAPVASRQVAAFGIGTGTDDKMQAESPKQTDGRTESPCSVADTSKRVSSLGIEQLPVTPLKPITTRVASPVVDLVNDTIEVSRIRSDEYISDCSRNLAAQSPKVSPVDVAINSKTSTIHPENDSIEVSQVASVNKGICKSMETKVHKIPTMPTPKQISETVNEVSTTQCKNLSTGIPSLGEDAGTSSLKTATIQPEDDCIEISRIASSSSETCASATAGQSVSSQVKELTALPTGRMSTLTSPPIVDQLNTSIEVSRIRSEELVHKATAHPQNCSTKAVNSGLESSNPVACANEGQQKEFAKKQRGSKSLPVLHAVRSKVDSDEKCRLQSIEIGPTKASGDAQSPVSIDTKQTASNVPAVQFERWTNDSRLATVETANDNVEVSHNICSNGGDSEVVPSHSLTTNEQPLSKSKEQFPALLGNGGNSSRKSSTNPLSLLKGRFSPTRQRPFQESKHHKVLLDDCLSQGTYEEGQSTRNSTASGGSSLLSSVGVSAAAAIGRLSPRAKETKYPISPRRRRTVIISKHDDDGIEVSDIESDGEISSGDVNRRPRRVSTSANHDKSISLEAVQSRSGVISTITLENDSDEEESGQQHRSQLRGFGGSALAAWGSGLKRLSPGTKHLTIIQSDDESVEVSDVEDNNIISLERGPSTTNRSQTIEIIEGDKANHSSSADQSLVEYLAKIQDHDGSSAGPPRSKLDPIETGRQTATPVFPTKELWGSDLHAANLSRSSEQKNMMSTTVASRPSEHLGTDLLAIHHFDSVGKTELRNSILEASKSEELLSSDLLAVHAAASTDLDHAGIEQVASYQENSSDESRSLEETRNDVVEAIKQMKYEENADGRRTKVVVETKVYANGSVEVKRSKVFEQQTHID